MARVLPILEAVLGAFLVSGVGLRWVASITSALLLVFIGAMTRALILHIQIKCGCFGNDEPLDDLDFASRQQPSLFSRSAVTIGAFLIKKRQGTVSS